MPIININGTNVPIPDQGGSPAWGQSIIQAFQLIAEALTVSVGPADVPPQVYVLSSNANTNLEIPNLSFSTTTVRGAVISYYVYRTTSDTTVTESGEIVVSYNADCPVNNKWNISREFTGGDQNNSGQGARCTFDITDVGQVRISTTLLSGTGYEGYISFSAKAILES